MMTRRILQLLLVCLTSQAFAGPVPLAREDVHRLLAAGVAPQVVVATLRSSGCAFRLNAEDLIALTKDRVPHEVLLAMITCTSSTASPSGADPCATTSSPVAFPDLEWDQAGAHFDMVTLSVSTAGLCLKRVEDQVRRPIPWSNVRAICEEPGFYRHVYLKLTARDPNLAPFVNDTALIFNGSPTALRPLFAYMRTVQPKLAVDCAVMEE